MNVGLAMLERGELAGLANIGIVLRALIENSNQKSQFLLLPRTGALSYEFDGLHAAAGRLRPGATSSIVRSAGLLEGVDEYRGDYYAIYDRWFGAAGYLFYPLDREVAHRLAGSRMWLN